MVFILRHLTTGITAVLGENIEYTLGRSRRNNILLRDTTCTQRHATIIIKQGIATVKLLSPKGVVYINGNQIHNETVLRPGDAIIFGENNCCYSFIDPNFQVFLDDSIMGDEKEVLCKALKELKVLNNYSDECSHFVTPILTLEKVKDSRILKHFLNKKEIVTPRFWIEMLKNINDAAEIPNIYKYMPILEQPLIEGGVEVIKCKKKTKTLFKDIPCVFFDEILEMGMKQIIMKCSGITFVHDGKVSFVQTLLKVMNFNTALVITPKGHEPSLPIDHFVNKLEQTKKKVYELCPDDIYISLLKGKLDVLGNNNSLEVVPNQNLNDIVVVDDDLPEETIKNKWNFRTLNGWLTPTKKKKTTIETKAVETRDKPSTSHATSDCESSDLSVPNGEIKRKKKQKTTAKLRSPIETEDKLDSDELPVPTQKKKTTIETKAVKNRDKPSTSHATSDGESSDLSVPNGEIRRKKKQKTAAKLRSPIETEEMDTDSDEVTVPNKRIEDVQKQRKKKFRSLSMSSESDSNSSVISNGKDSELRKLPKKNTTNEQNREHTKRRHKNNSELPMLPIENRINRQVREEHPKKRYDSKSGLRSRSKILKINPLAKFKEISKKEHKDAMNDVLTNKNLENSQSAAFKCFLHCLLTKYGWMDEDGGFLLHDIRVTLQQSDVEIPSLEYILYICTMVKSTDRCQRAYFFTECFWKKMEEQQPSEDEFFYSIEQK